MVDCGKTVFGRRSLHGTTVWAEGPDINRPRHHDNNKICCPRTFGNNMKQLVAYTIEWKCTSTHGKKDNTKLT